MRNWRNWYTSRRRLACAVSNSSGRTVLSSGKLRSSRRTRSYQRRIARLPAVVTPDKVGARLSAIVEITLDVQAADRMAEFERVVADEAAVLQCYRVSPGPDFVLIVQVADMPAYHALAHRLFTTHSNVRNVKAYFSTFRSKFETRIAV